MIPCVRPVFCANDLNHDPSAARNVTGLAEELLNAFERGWLHSFMTTNWLTLSKRRATAAAHAANCWIRYVSPHDSGSLEGAHRLPPVKTIECAG